MSEIGGYLEFEKSYGSLYHDEAIRLNCGRNSLAYLIELRQIEVLWIPDYICDSVAEVCEKYKIHTCHYTIGEDLKPIYDFKIDNDDYLYLVDYFGQLNDKDVAIARDVSAGRLIVDEAHNYFRKPWGSLDTIYTSRKFFGVADGAFLCTGDNRCLERPLPLDESYSRMNYILGRFERSAREFFEESKKNNRSFANEPIKRMSALTENILRGIDYEHTITRRQDNARILHDALADINELPVCITNCLYMYPLLVSDTADIRSMLASQDIFIPTLWPSVLSQRPAGSVAYKYAQNLLPLPIDQRYGETEMHRVLNALDSFLGI